MDTPTTELTPQQRSQHYRERIAYIEQSSLPNRDLLLSTYHRLLKIHAQQYKPR